jgi:hypothetical protein
MSELQQKFMRRNSPDSVTCAKAIEAIQFQAGDHKHAEAPPSPPPESPTTPRSPRSRDFARTLWRLVEGPSPLCVWDAAGSRVLFPDPDAFAEVLGPAHFRQEKWTSFARLLNMHGFLKVAAEPRDGRRARAQAFEHACFKRDSAADLHLVARAPLRRRSSFGPEAEAPSEGAELRARVEYAESRLAELEQENAYLRAQQGQDAEAPESASLAGALWRQLSM